MSAINVLLAVLGSGITLMVVVGIVFITPRGVEAHTETPDLQPTPAPSRNGAEPQLGLSSATASLTAEPPADRSAP